ncbi:glycosyltransferase [Cytobacillus firmus]|uniref:glycosyltransferase n=1 Tax=Cytobacillus firmus TaxID=1399 RepID=UPI003690A692
MPKRMLLSICMMVKDEEVNLKRCLESLKPLLHRYDTELIIIDTGSIDNTISIAKKYTSKVYMHKWNDDFSSMRNISISYAVGEWIFILDADEQIQNIDILELLLEDKNKLSSFNTLQCYVKNYTHSNLDKFVLQPSLRFFRNSSDFKYEGIVHNQPLFKKPILDTDIVINHYGYLNDDNVLMEKKFTRTSKLLIGELTKDPNNIYYRYQLAKSYYMHGDFWSSLEEIRKAYLLLENVKSKKELLYVYETYAKSAQACKKFNETIEICQEGLRISEHYIDLYYYLGFSYLFLNKKSEAQKTFEKYFRLIKEKESNEFLKNSSFEIYHIDSSSSSKVAKELILLLIDSEKYKDAFAYLEFLLEDEFKAKALSEICFKGNNFIQLKLYYDKSEYNTKKNIISSLEILKKSCTAEERLELESNLAKLEGKYGLYNTIRISNNLEIRETKIKEFLKEFSLETDLEFYSEIFLYMLDSWNRIIFEFKKLNNRDIKFIVHRLLKESKDFNSKVITYLSEQSPRKNDFHLNRVNICISNVVLLDFAEKNKRHNNLDLSYHEIFRKYIEQGINYIQLLYRIDFLRMSYKTLENAEDQLFSIMYFVKEAIKKDDIKMVLKYYKEAVKVYPYMAFYLENYLHNIYIHFAGKYLEQGIYFTAIELLEDVLLMTENADVQLMLIKKLNYIHSMEIIRA